MKNAANNLQFRFGLPPGITRVFFDPDLDKTPARCWRDTGVVAVSEEFLTLPEDQQKFILSHEGGHIVLDTSDEYAADDFATDYCVSSGTSKKAMIRAMTDVLTFPDDRPAQKQEQILRTNRQFRRLLQYDAEQPQNEKHMCANCSDCNCSSFEGEVEKYLSMQPDNFGGKRKARRDAKNNKTDAKADFLRDKGDAKVLEAQAKLELAKQGIVDGIGAIGQGLGGMAKGATGRGESTGSTPPTEDDKILGMEPTTFYVVVAVVVVAAGLFFWMRRRKKAK